MLVPQTIGIDFGQGVDTKTDPKQVMSGRFITLENALFTKAKQITKRPGYDSMPLTIFQGGTITNPMAVKSFGAELVCAGTATGAATNGKRLFSYSTTSQSWVDKGKYEPCKVTDQVITADVTADGTFGAVSGNYLLSTWVGHPPAGHLGVYYTLMDTSTNTFLVPETLIVQRTLSDVLTCCVLAPGKFIVFYQSFPGSVLAHKIITISGTTVSVSAEVLTTIPGSGTSSMYAIPTSFGCGLIWQGADTEIATFDTTGALLHTTVLAAYSATTFNVFLDYDGTHFWAFYVNVVGSVLYYQVLDSILNVVLAETMIASVNPTIPFSALSTSGTTQTVYCSINGCFNTVSITSTGTVGSPVTRISNAAPMSAPFTLNGSTYIAVLLNSTLQRTSFLIDLSDYQVVAKFLYGNSALFSTGTHSPSVPLYQISTGVIGGVFNYDAGVNFNLNGSNSIIYVQFDFGDPELYQSVYTAQGLLWNGGIVIDYDGQPATELGFNAFPEITSITPHTTGGSLADGTYEYFVVYRWYDAQGNLHQSAPSVGVQTTISGGAGSGSITLSYTNLGLTAKQSPRLPVLVGVFRTDPGGTTPHLVSDSTQNNAENPSSTSSFTDTGGVIDSNEILYTSGGVIPNNAPPASIVLVAHNNRVWLVDRENQNTVWYCKSIAPGTGISFSQDLVNQIDQRGGKIIALASMDEKLVMLEQNVPYVMSGDGVNDVGTGSTLSFPQQIPTDVGCSTSRGVVVTPMGVVFKSPKGIYLLDRALNVQYWGMPVEQYNNLTIMQSLIMPTRNQIRFITLDGVALLYDYVFNQWSTFTNHMGFGADNWNGDFVYARTDGKIYLENDSKFLDDTLLYAVRGQTAWLKLQSIQGFQRIRRFLMLGDFTSGASFNYGIQVSAAYDYTSTFQPPIVRIFSDQTNYGSVLQYREFLPIQKCEAISFLIEELPTGDPLETINLTNLGFDVALKKGLYKLPASSSVG